MKLNKIFALLLAFAMLFAFVACADKAADTEGNNQQPEAPKTIMYENVFKAAYVAPDAGVWEQPTKFQFAFTGFDPESNEGEGEETELEIEAGNTVSIIILPLERSNMKVDNCCFRESSGSYTQFPTEKKLITKGKYAGWYEMSCTPTADYTSIMLCLRHDTAFTEEDAAVEQAVYIARFTINGNEIPLENLHATKCVVTDMNSEIVNLEVPESRISATLAANPEAPEFDPTEAAEGTESGESTEGAAE